MQTLLRNWFDRLVLEAVLDCLRLEQAKGSLQAFTRTIADGPTVSRRTKRPATFGNVPVEFLSVLIAFVLVGR